LDFDSGKVGAANNTQLKFEEATPAMPKMSLRSYSKTKVCNWNFGKRKWRFWIRIRNECPVISDLDADKPLAFCTTYLCEAAFLKLNDHQDQKPILFEKYW